MSQFLMRTALFMLVCLSSINLYAQDDGIETHLYLFTMPAENMSSLLEDGVTRSELDAMQTDHFRQSSLVASDEAIALHEGEDTHTLSGEELNSLEGLGNDDHVVFMFYIARPQQDDYETFIINYRSYVAQDGDTDNPAAVKQGSWAMPQNEQDYRYFDFRNVNRVRGNVFVYEIDIETGGETHSHKVVLQP